MRTNRIYGPLMVMSLFIFGIFSMGIADDLFEDRDKDREKAKITGTVEPAVAATVNVIDANYEMDMERDRDQYGERQEEELEHQERFPEQQNNIVATAEVDPETGEFEVTGLDAGTYRVEIEPHDPQYIRAEYEEEIELEADEEKDLGTIDLEETDDDDWFEDDDEWQ